VSQSRTMSAIERLVDTVAGFFLSMLIWQLIVGPVFGVPLPIVENVAVQFIFMGASMARGYCFRRLFNRLES
jgi:hypothetical protein